MACTESAPPSTSLPSAAPSEPTATSMLQPTPTPWARPTATPRSTPWMPTPRPTATPRPTPTPRPTATPRPTPLPGTARGNPVPVGVSVEITSESSWNEGRVFEVAVVQTIRGSEALHALLSYDEPELGHEWILVRMQIRYLRGEGATNNIHRETNIFSSLGYIYDREFAVEPEPDIVDIVLFPGAAQEGWLAWQVGINDPNPLLLFGADYRYDGGVWLDLYPRRSVTPTPTLTPSVASMNEWVFDTINPATDARIAYTYVEDAPFRLYIRCESDQFYAYVDWGRRITGNPTVEVFHKIGNQQTESSSWGISTNYEAMFLPVSMLESMIQQMFEADEFTVSVKPDQGLIQGVLITATFKIHGMYEAVRSISEVCRKTTVLTTPTATPTPTPIPIPVGVGPSPIAAGNDHTCGLQADGTAVCWGDDSRGQSSPRKGQFIGISSDTWESCALRSDGYATCWGSTINDDSYEDQQFVFLDLGGGDSCGIRIDGPAFCWQYAASLAPSGRLTTISAGSKHSCALRESGVAVCWGDEDAQQDRPAESERYIAIGVGDNYTCALRLDGSPICWGLDNKWKNATPKNEQFAYLAVGDSRACALRKDGTAACWDEDGIVPEDDYFGLRPPQNERFTHISVGSHHICGVRVDGYPVCWGYNSDGRASPPSGVRLATPDDLRGFSRQGQALTSANSLPSAIAQAARSVVRIEVPLEQYSSSAGTGVIVDVDTQTGAAQLLTAYHVIDERPQGIVVTAEDEASIQEYDARIVDYDSERDIALLSICCSSTFQAAALSRVLPETGESVFVIGYGKYDENRTVSQGRVIGTKAGSGGTRVGTTAEVVEGDSGGPIISGQTSEVVGIILAIVVEPDSYDWLILDQNQRAHLRDVLGLWQEGTGIAISSPDVINALALP